MANEALSWIKRKFTLKFGYTEDSPKLNEIHLAFQFSLDSYQIFDLSRIILLPLVSVFSSIKWKSLYCQSYKIVIRIK